MSLALRLKTYLIESVAELKKVVWPTKKQTINYTMLVFAMSIGLGIFFAAIDYVFSTGLGFIITK